MSRNGTSRALPTSHDGTDYLFFLPWLIRAQDIANYLEIGVNMGHLMSRIEVDYAIGVDPAFIINANVAKGKKALHLIQKTSDRFFLEEQELLRRISPQLAFLDGMHVFEYLLRDFINTEAASNKRSLIVMHDCLPLSPEMCHRSQTIANDLTLGTPYHGWWTGDVWKIVPILRCYRPDLRIVCFDAAPTGLVCVTNLDPSSNVLNDRYLEIVEEYARLPNTNETLTQLYASTKIKSATSMMENMTHGLSFRN